MARPGVTYAEIAEAANQIMGQGKNPTIEQVRLILGTGSSTTIANHLREWKEAQDKSKLISAKENVPQELVGTLKGLWERVLGHADEKTAAIQNNYDQTISELQFELEKYKNNNRRWQKLFNKWTTEKLQLAAENAVLKNKYEALNENYICLYSKHDAFLCELEEKEQRINELRQLHHQLQNNIEHDRQLAATQQQRDEDKHEKQIQQMERRIQELQQQIKMNDLNYATLQSNYEINLRENLSLINEKNKTTHLISHWQQQNSLLQKSDAEKNSAITSMHSQISVLTEQLNYCQDEIMKLQSRLTKSNENKRNSRTKIAEPA